MLDLIRDSINLYFFSIIVFFFCFTVQLTLVISNIGFIADIFSKVKFIIRSNSSCDNLKKNIYTYIYNYEHYF